MESWREEGGGGTTWIVRSSRDTGLGSEGENFVYRFLARYAGRRGSCSSATERRKKERREEGKKNPPRRGVKTRNGISVIPNIWFVRSREGTEKKKGLGRGIRLRIRGRISCCNWLSEKRRRDSRQLRNDRGMFFGRLISDRSYCA